MPQLLVTCTWDDAPHLDKKAKDELLESFPPHQRDARSKGIPQLGVGAVYPISEDEIVVDDFAIPPHWPRAFALDVGWNRTATVWGALDRNTNVLYVYSEHYRGRTTPKEHADIIKLRGAWIPGVIDPASTGSSQADGQQVFSLYRDEGLNLSFADNDVEAGIFAVWQRMKYGTLKIFRTCINLRQELRLYRRENTGKIHKPHLPANLPEGKTAAEYGDHLCDCVRYLVMSGIERMAIEPIGRPKGSVDWDNWKPPAGRNSWMGT